LLQDIRKRDPQVEAAAEVIATVRPDVVLLTNFDWDHEGLALRAFEALLQEKGLDYPYLFAPRPNSGLESGQDLDGNGKPGEPRDAQGYGRFTGDGGLALLSRLPIATEAAQDFSAFLWRDLPDGLIRDAGLSPEAAAVQRLSSTGHWDVPLRLPGGDMLHLWAFAATPPLFDGPEDRNGRRNHDEAAFWLRYLAKDLPGRAPQAAFVLAGNINLDPQKGEGRRAALTALLAHPALQDPQPESPGARLAPAGERGGAPMAQDTAWWPGPGGLRLDYLLPSAGIGVQAAGVFWPAPGAPGAEAAALASPHRLVWADLLLP
jgi:endonuclease/exonuclease/phosphatase family metal-dependent hydrolase